jgi:phosphotransferase system enzyme I (PtsP)
VTLSLGEGLVGASLKEFICLRLKDGFLHPSFKYITGINEERFKSFLVTPIHRGISRIGVLILQRKEKDFFKADDEVAVKAIASQLANIMENAKLLLQSNAKRGHEKARGRTKLASCMIKGKSAAGGFAMAQAHRIEKTRLEALSDSMHTDKIYSMIDFERALADTEKQLIEIQKKAETCVSDAGSMIFAAHILMLMDRGFVSGIRNLIEGGENPPRAVAKVAQSYCDIFAASQNPGVREKTQDVADLALRLVGNLTGETDDGVALADRIIVADELYPSEIIKYFTQGIAGVVLTSGGVTSHVAILARSLKIPLVIADAPEISETGPDDVLLLDADTGNVYVNPTDEIKRQFDESNAAKAGLAGSPAITNKAKTGNEKRVRLMINVNLLRDMEAAKRLPCDGIGLYRTEFPFILRNSFPSEEEQYVIYKRLMDDAGDLEVTFRTLDVGGDKVLAYYHTQKEENPFLGMRSIRFSLSHKEIFKQQLYAILRAGHGANIRIMFPMISSVDELTEAKAVLAQCAQNLVERGVAHNPGPKIGIMIEIPSVIPIIDSLASMCDFFSIGTNDLIQYTLAVDRTNDKVSRYYLPHHPAVLRSIDKVAQAARKHGKGVSICGDMANNPLYIPFFLGIGIGELSVDPVYFGKAHECIARTDTASAVRFAQALLAEDEIAGIERLIEAESDIASGN